MTAIEQFRRIAQPPAWALKKIGGGRLKGMTDIKPAWRIQAMTEVYGLCGVGWKYEVVSQGKEDGPEGQMFAFVDINLYIRVDDEWSSPIPGCGGSMLIEKEKGGLHANDEAFKMATTDALSFAMKMIGMAADVYAGQWDGSKYRQDAKPSPQISPEDQKKIENGKKGIAEAKSTEEMKQIGMAWKETLSPAVQDVLRPLWSERNAILTQQEKESGHSRSNETPDQSNSN